MTFTDIYIISFDFGGVYNFFLLFFSDLIQERLQNTAPSDNGRDDIVNRPINNFTCLLGHTSI